MGPEARDLLESVDKITIRTEKLSGKDKKLKRKEELARLKDLKNILQLANEKSNLLDEFQAFSKFNRNGLDLSMECQSGDKLSSEEVIFLQRLLEENMQQHYGSKWKTQSKLKLKEMTDADARYILIRHRTSTQTSAIQTTSATKTRGRDQPPSVSARGEEEELGNADREGGVVEGGLDLAGAVHIRFVEEEKLPVLYVYELQLQRNFQGKGVGRFIMQLIELVARKNKMRGIMLTVQKRNEGAFQFYTTKLKYSVSPTSPGQVDPLADKEEYDYDILCKIFDEEAKAMLQAQGTAARQYCISEY